MPEIDIERARRENVRWLILQTLNSARPIGACESLILSTIQAVVPDLTERELRIELQYLSDRKLLEITGQEIQPQWFASLLRHGVDVVEYTVPCQPGIARPKKYW